MARIIDIHAPETLTLRLNSADNSYHLPVDLRGFSASEENSFIQQVKQNPISLGLATHLHSLLDHPAFTLLQKLALRQLRYQITKEAGYYWPTLVRIATEVDTRRAVLALDLETIRNFELLQIATTGLFLSMQSMTVRTFEITDAMWRNAKIEGDEEVRAIGRDSHRKLARSLVEKQADSFDLMYDSLQFPRQVARFELQAIVQKNDTNFFRFFRSLLNLSIDTVRLLHGI